MSQPEITNVFQCMNYLLAAQNGKLDIIIQKLDIIIARLDTLIKLLTPATTTPPTIGPPVTDVFLAYNVEPTVKPVTME